MELHSWALGRKRKKEKLTPDADLTQTEVDKDQTIAKARAANRGELPSAHRLDAGSVKNAARGGLLDRHIAGLTIGKNVQFYDDPSLSALSFGEQGIFGQW